MSARSDARERAKTSAGEDGSHELRAMIWRVREHFAATAADTRERMLSREVRRALEAVPRHRFVPPGESGFAYEDSALPIGCGQTISQPFIVALMTQLGRVGPSSVVLEIGTGSGYQAAVLGQLVRHVYSVELVPELAERARATLAELGYANISVRCSDGFEGWKEHAPYDAILVTAAAHEPPPALLEQLAAGGRMLIPLGEPGRTQELTLISKSRIGEIDRRAVLPVAFVPFERA